MIAKTRQTVDDPGERQFHWVYADTDPHLEDLVRRMEAGRHIGKNLRVEAIM